MYHFKKTALANLFISVFALCNIAQADVQESSQKIDFDSNSHWGVAFGYMSWQENLSLQSGTIKDYSSSNFSGNSLNFTYENYLGSAPRHGYRLSAGVSAGVATAGGTQPTLSYQFANLSWTGEYLSALYSFQLSPIITFCIGPFMLARQISYQTLSNGVSASSGAGTNFGGEADVRFDLVKHWDLQFELAGLASNASTLWDFSVGYRY